MNWMIAFLPILSWSSTLLGNSTTFSEDRLNNFYDELLCEEKSTTATVGLTGVCTNAHSEPTPPPPPPPPPPVDPIQPVAPKGYIALVISNLTGQSKDDVYIMMTSNTLTEVLSLGSLFTGQMVFNTVSSSTYTPDYSYKLSSFPVSTTGANNYIAFVPNEMTKGRIYFSIGKPLNFMNTGSTIAPPTGGSYSDPNFNVLYDYAELTMVPKTPQPGMVDYIPAIDTSNVDNWGLPLYLALYTFDTDHPSVVMLYSRLGSPQLNPTGFLGNRDTLISTFRTGLTDPWDRLPIPFYTTPYTPTTPTTYLRILSPKVSVAVSQPQGNYSIPKFPSNYLTTYGVYDYLDYLFVYYSGGKKLYIQTAGDEGSSGDIYEAVVNYAERTFHFRSTNPNHPYYWAYLKKSDVTIAGIYSGVPEIQKSVGSDAPNQDIIILKKFFGSAFVVGLLAVDGLFDSAATCINDANLSAHLPRTGGPLSLPAYFNNPFPTPLPCYNLYDLVLHQQAIVPTSPPYPTPPPALPSLGLCYGYDYDDVLMFSSLVSPPRDTLESAHMYVMMTLSAIPTLPTGVFNDPSSYNLTINTAPPTTPFQYRRGSSGDFTSATSGTTITAVTSTMSNPFQIQYHGLIFNVYPKYQFFDPVGQYTSSHNTIVQGATFTPNIPAAPTAFTIQLPGL